MYYSLSSDPQVNLYLFETAEYTLAGRLSKRFEGENWSRLTDLATHEDEDVSANYKAWMQCRNAIDKTRETILKRSRSDADTDADE